MVEVSTLSRTFKLGLLAGTALIAAAAVAQQPSPVPSPGSTPAPPETTSVASGDNGDANAADIVVTGTRRSLEDALNTKRNSVEVLDSISAEGIGKLPDLNLAESLQRLPGVQINRSAQRRNGTVSIRGLPGDFSQTLINGQYLASPDVSNFSFGQLRSEVFSGIDVQKATNATALTGGLSGLVNLKTGSPLSSPNQFAITADGRYEELTEKVAPGGAVVFSRQLIPGVLGIRAAVGIRTNNFREDIAQINTYDRLVGGATPDLSDDVYIPRQLRFPILLTKGYNISSTAAIEWKPTDELSASVRGLFSHQKDSRYESQFLLDVGAQTVRTALGTTQEGAFGQTQSRFRSSNPILQDDSRYENGYFDTGAVTGNVEWKRDGWKLDGTVHYTKAKRSQPTYGSVVQQRAAATGTNGIVFEYNTGAGKLSDLFYDLQSGTARPNLVNTYGSPLAPTYRELRTTANPNLSYLGGYRVSSEREDELAFQADLEKELDFGPVKSIQLGGVYRDKGQSQVNPLQSMFGIDSSKINNGFYFASTGGNFLNSRAGNVDPADYAELNIENIRKVLAPSNLTNLPANFAIGPGGYAIFTDSTAISNTYNNKQKIYGGYAQINLDQQFGDFRLRGNGGVRYEKSTRDTIARDASNQPVPLNFKFDNWLPSANLVLEAFEKFVVRGSYTKTLRRPQVDSFAVVRSVAVDGNGLLITVNRGAANLKPFTSDNYDLAFEYYNRAGSSIALTLFKKNVKDYAGVTRACPDDGGGLGFGPFSLASGVCRTTQPTPAGGSFPAVQTNATVQINVTANQDRFTLKGYEVSVQQNLSFLPAPWNGFGGSVNYTRVDFKNSSSAFRLSEISKDTVNAIIYYETPVFGLRAAYNYRSGYFLGSGGTAAGADRFVKSRPQLDLTASLNLSDKLSLTAEVFNVTDEIVYEYEGAKTRARQYTELGRTVNAGFTYKF